ncbi:Aste57867_9824 [Aphanomyces stellatus]|uniref:Aste57867_9824 protein n=1 Tax=Aphanomyces stellatus TaxID=120398 RepID=A0A485KNU2_9STRA|nr:hypothetical protein As57867_009785 [Aphanomyces stellatus]VFT86703.1 Aste57867_9824 [Aphanomyces stellatus]
MERTWKLASVWAGVAPFLEAPDHRRAAWTCKTWHVLMRAHRPKHVLLPLDEDCAKKVIDVVVRVGRSRSKKSLWSHKHAHTLGYDLYFVMSGLRVSCLVDCVFMEPSVATLLLETLRESNPLFKHVVAIFLGDDLFFLHRTSFVHAKLLDLTCDFRSLLFVDVTKTQLDSTPKICAAPPALTPFLRRLLSDMMTLSAAILDISSVVRLYSLSSTAVAGLLLHYPVIYSFQSASDTTTNALAMQPLLVFHATLTFNGQVHSLVKFSFPAALASHRPSCAALLRSLCRGHFPRSSPVHLETTTVTLASVAL